MTWPPTTHQDVEDEITSLRTEIANLRGWATTLIARAGIAESALSTGASVWVTGRYYGSNLYDANVSSALSPSRIYLTPMYFSQARSVDRISINIVSAGLAANNARLGIYSASATTGLPSTVLLDAGTVSTASTGVKEITISQSITGPVWLAIMLDGGTITSFPAGSIPNVAGITSMSSAMQPTFCIGYDTATIASSAFPTLVGATPLLYGPTTTPAAVMLRAV